MEVWFLVTEVVHFLWNKGLEPKLKPKNSYIQVCCADLRSFSHRANPQTLPSLMTDTVLTSSWNIWRLISATDESCEENNRPLLGQDVIIFHSRWINDKSLQEKNSAKYCLRLSPSPFKKDYTWVAFLVSSFQCVRVYVLFSSSTHSFLHLWTPFYQKRFWQNKGVKRNSGRQTQC